MNELLTVHEFDEFRTQQFQLIKEAYEILGNKENCFLVLTGSWGIEAITGKTIPHNDVDMKFYNPGLIGQHFLPLSHEGQLEIENIFPIKIIHQVEDVITISVFNGGREFNIPLCKRELKNGSEEIEVFAKKLEYQIATWAIRIFGKPKKPKRQVVERDFFSLVTLISTPYLEEDVLKWIKENPQFDQDIFEIQGILENIRGLKQQNHFSI